MWHPESYTTVASVFPHLLGLIYFFAITPFIFQTRGLIGQQGILPVDDFLQRVQYYYPKKRFLYVPSLFWFNSSDTALMGLTLFGAAVSLLLMLGFYPPLCLGLLFILYLSTVSVGQDFLSFGWESFLLEITFYAFWMSLTPIPTTYIRAVMYDYKFSTYDEKRKLGWWWHRTFVGSYSPVLALKPQSSG